MKNIKILVLFAALWTLTACGGGGGSSGGSAPYKPTGPFDKDGPRSKSFSALYGSEVSDSVCLPKVPALDRFNAWADAEAARGNRSNREFVTRVDNGFESGIELINQNTALLKSLSALIFETKFASRTEGRMVHQPNKTVYTRIPDNCETVSCVGEAVFNRTYGARLYYHHKFGFILSELTDVISERTNSVGKLEPFKSDEHLESVLFAIGTLPKNMIPLKAGEYYSSFAALRNNILLSPNRAGPGGDTAAEAHVATINGSLYADVNIFLYRRWQDTTDFYDRVYIVFHELIHMYDKIAFFSGTDEWKAFSKWKVVNGFWDMGDKDQSCSAYGESSPAEDFAECGALYRFAPARLKAINAKKYDFFKNKVFKGIEFEAESSCASQTISYGGI